MAEGLKYSPLAAMFRAGYVELSKVKKRSGNESMQVFRVFGYGLLAGVADPAVACRLVGDLATSTIRWANPQPA